MGAEIAKEQSARLRGGLIGTSLATAEWIGYRRREGRSDVVRSDQAQRSHRARRRCSRREECFYQTHGSHFSHQNHSCLAPHEPRFVLKLLVDPRHRRLCGLKYQFFKIMI